MGGGMALGLRIALLIYIAVGITASVAQVKQGLQLKTLGIISVVGDTFTINSVHKPAPGEEHAEFPIESWKLDLRVAEKAKSLLAKSFKTKSISVRESTFAVLADRKPDVDPEAALAAFIKRIASGTKCDYYLLISRGVGEYSGDKIPISGLGVVRDKHLIYGKQDIVHALTMLRVYDASFNLLRTERGTLDQSSFLASVKGPNMSLEDDKRLPDAPAAAFADPRAKELSWQLLEQSLAKTLPKLFAAN
jgi:hypothetical protein